MPHATSFQTVLCQAVCCSAAAPGLEELELALNEVTPDGAKELAAALAGKSKLQKLNLRENELEDRGVILLCGPIQSLSSLRVLDLAQNQVRKHTRHPAKPVDLNCIPSAVHASRSFVHALITHTSSQSSSISSPE